MAGDFQKSRISDDRESDCRNGSDSFVRISESTEGTPEMVSCFVTGRRKTATFHGKESFSLHIPN